MSIAPFFATIKASTAEVGVQADTLSAEGAVSPPSAGVHGGLFLMDVTSAATEADDTLDVTVEGTINGTNWFEILSFVQVLGNGGAIQHYEPIQLGANSTGFTGSSSVSAGDQIAVLAASYRVKWTIVDPSGTNAAFTFSVGVYWH